MSKPKRLFIIRHAKSSWKDSSLSDFDRPLNKRGIFNAPIMGDRLKAKEIIPDIILSSSALRAKMTVEIIAKKVKFKKEILFENDIYNLSEDDIHKVLTELDDENSVVFLFGHNPELNHLAEEYVGFYENIPTCGIVEIEFDCRRWKSISSKNAKLISFDYPKRYKKV